MIDVHVAFHHSFRMSHLYQCHSMGGRKTDGLTTGDVTYMPNYTERGGVIFSDETEGAVAYRDCPTRLLDRYRNCLCKPVCAVCGQHKHTAVHGPLYGKQAGSKPWGHMFVPAGDDAEDRA